MKKKYHRTSSINAFFTYIKAQCMYYLYLSGIFLFVNLYFILFKFVYINWVKNVLSGAVPKLRRRVFFLYILITWDVILVFKCIK